MSSDLQRNSILWELDSQYFFVVGFMDSFLTVTCYENEGYIMSYAIMGFFSKAFCFAITFTA